MNQYYIDIIDFAMIIAVTMSLTHGLFLAIYMIAPVMGLIEVAYVSALWLLYEYVIIKTSEKDNY